MGETHPLDDFAWSVADDEGGPVTRVHGPDADCTIVGNTSPSSVGERRHRQTMAAVNADTDADVQLYEDFKNNDPDFEAVRQQMVELVEHVSPEDRQDIQTRHRRYNAEYVALKEKMYANQQDLPRQYEIEEVKQAIADERNQGGSTNRLRHLEHKLASLYGGR